MPHAYLRAKTCKVGHLACNKATFATLRQARKALGRMPGSSVNRPIQSKPVGAMKAYCCDRCGMYHLGHD